MKSLIIIFSLILPTSALANDYRDEIQNFFSLYESGKIIEAIDSIYSTNPWVSSAADSIQNIKTQLQGINKLVGNYDGKELIDTMNVKDRFVHITYLALYDRQPVRMEFQLYRPKDKWIIYSFSFDIDIVNEIEQGARKRVAAGK